MKRFGALTIFFILSMLLTFLGCESKDNPVTPSGEVDQRLIGTWVRVDTALEIAAPYNLTVRSFTITANKEIFENGWDFSTGRLTRQEHSEIGELVTASNATLAYQRSRPTGAWLDSYEYKFESIYLTLNDIFGKKRYKKAHPNSKIFPVITCTASFHFLDKKINNINVFSFPSAKMFANQDDRATLSIMSEDYNLDIQILNFTGVGTYQSSQIYVYMSSFKNGVYHYYINKSSQAGNIIFESFDPVKRVCSGKFNLIVNSNVLVSDSASTFLVKDGTFAVPVYN